jgi:hypothetical protein
MTNNARLLALMATVSYCRAQEVRDEGDQKRSCVLMGCWAHVFGAGFFFLFVTSFSNNPFSRRIYLFDLSSQAV